MAPLPEGTFRLNTTTSTGGVTWGGPDRDITVLQDGFSISAPNQRIQDTPDPYRDGLLFGRDFYDGPVLNWSLAFRDAGGAVMQDVTDFKVNWRDWKGLAVPGAMQSLEFTLGGQSLRVWGRTRQFAFVP